MIQVAPISVNLGTKRVILNSGFPKPPRIVRWITSAAVKRNENTFRDYFAVCEPVSLEDCPPWKNEKELQAFFDNNPERIEISRFMYQEFAEALLRCHRFDDVRNEYSEEKKQ